jgi:hypothetical protein
MTDKELFALLITTLQTGLTAQSLSVGIQQNYQPTQEGAPSGPTIFLQKIGDHRYGFPSRVVAYSSPGVSTLTETQLYESRFQFDALAIQDPSDTSGPTASDLLNWAAMIFQGEAAIATLAANQVGVLRVTDIRQPFFRDEKERFEASPSFDLIVRYPRVMVTSIPSTKLFAGTVDPVL